MKKILSMAVAVLLCTSINAQLTSATTAKPQANKHVANSKLVKKDFSAVQYHEVEKPVNMNRLGRKLTLNPQNIKPVEGKKVSKAMQTPQPNAMKQLSKATKQSIKGMKPVGMPAVKAMRKAAAFKEKYTGKGYDYLQDMDVEWTMTPVVGTLEDESEVLGMFDVIPMPAEFADLYPDGIPVEYTRQDDKITIEPQPVISWQNEAKDTTFYITLCSVNSDNEDGTITMQLAEDGLLKIVDGNYICYAIFANTPFDDTFGDDTFFGAWELITYVRYVYDGQKEGITIDNEYKGYGVDFRENKGVKWTMGKGTYTEDGEDYPILLNMSPFDEMFSIIYPDGIFVEYEQNGNTITVKPQVLATTSDDDGNPEYIMLHSGTSDDGVIVITVGYNGSLTTIKDESIIISAWKTSKFDPTYDTYDGWYTYTERVKYLLPGDPEPAPEDVSCAPDELMLFAPLTNTLYTFKNNLAVVAPFATQNFINTTLDVATSYSWSVTENDEETRTITADTKDFALTTIHPEAAFTDLSLTAACGDAVSEPSYFGCVNKDDDGNPLYEKMYIYASGGQSSFSDDEGNYPLMSRFNPDGDLAFYTNWATPDYTTAFERNPYSIAKLYSYQGKPAAPLFLTGVTLPILDFKDVKDDFNLHMVIYKCERDASTGKITLGDIIAEADATVENVTTTYESGEVNFNLVDFNEMYKEDEFGMSESVDYLFIEDEFMVVFSGIDNGTFSGRFGSQVNDNENNPVLWFEMSGEDGSMYSYNGWMPALLIGLDDATYGYLHTEDDTNLLFASKGGENSIHVEPMYYGFDENDQPTYYLDIESITINGEEEFEMPEWLEIAVANEDYTIGTAYDDDGDPYNYFVNGIDYDLVFQVASLGEGESERKAEITFMQPGARLTVTLIQGDSQGVSAIVTKTPLNNSRVFNLAGQNVKNVKGIVVKDGRKILVK